MVSIEKTLPYIYYLYLPNIANTASSFTISIDPREIKYRETKTSPWWTRVSPGGAWVVLNFMDKALENNIIILNSRII